MWTPIFLFSPNTNGSGIWLATSWNGNTVDTQQIENLHNFCQWFLFLIDKKLTWGNSWGPLRERKITYCIMMESDGGPREAVWFVLPVGSLCAWSLSCIQLFVTLLDGSSPGLSVRGIFQARMLEWVTVSSSRASSWPWDRTLIPCVSYIAGGFFCCWSVGGALWLAWHIFNTAR